MALETQTKLPIIDFTKVNLNPGSTSWIETSTRVKHALEEYGSFVAIYDRVSSDLTSEVFDSAEELFELPAETKVQNKSEKLYYGYVGNLAHIPIHESVGIEDATTLEGVQGFTDVMWPSGNDKFCGAVLSYTKKVAELEQMVEKMVFESYGVDKYYDSHIKSNTYLLRLLKYRKPRPNETNVGGDIHTDKGFLTILHQNQVNGLQIQPRNGDWTDVDFPPQSFVVMAGDAFLAWSNDRIHSAKHQVILRGKNTRYSLALFAYNTAIIKTPEELVDEEHPLQFNPFDNFGLLQSYFNDPTRLTESTAKFYCGIHV